MEGAKTLGSVFYDWKLMFFRYVVDLSHICALPIKADWQDGPGSTGDRGFQPSCVQISRAWIHICEDRRRTHQRNHLRRCNKRKRRRDHFVTRADFSWMGQALMLMGFVLLGMIVCSMLFGMHLGVIISCVGIGLAGGYILYFTSQVMNRFRTDQHVVAALCLFAAVALLFYYILLLMMSRD